MKNILSILLICLCLGSCKKYLDEPSDLTKAYPNTVQNCQLLLDNPQVNDGTPQMPIASSDDYFLTQAKFNTYPNPNPSRSAYLWGEYLVANYNGKNDWINSYTPVYFANICLQSIDNIEKGNNVPAWNNVKGSALFIRAYYFLQLAWTYAKVYDESTASHSLGIALKSDPDLYSPTVRANVKETYERIIADAKQSLFYLPAIPSHPMRPSKAAAYGLLARTYLSMNDYSNGLKYADSCLQLRSALIDFNGDADIVNPFGSALSPFRKFNKETIFYTKVLGTVAIDAFDMYVDTSLTALYNVNDLRATAYFSGSGLYRTFKGSYNQDFSHFSGIATDEMILIRAECYARLGNKVDALKDLNSLLVKRWTTGTFVPVTATTELEAIQKILIERRKELIFRGLRWADLKRLNRDPIHAITIRRFIDNQFYELLPNDNRYALPIPVSIIEQTGMPQNPR